MFIAHVAPELTVSIERKPTQTSRIAGVNPVWASFIRSRVRCFGVRTDLRVKQTPRNSFVVLHLTDEIVSIG